VHVKTIKGTTLPANGAIVTFSASSGRRGPVANDVQLVQQGAGETERSDRMTCPHCSKQMVPRLVTYQGQPDKSFCPFCAGEIANYSSNWQLWLAAFVAFFFILYVVVR